MWSSINIRLQLVIFMTLVVVVIEISTLFVVDHLYKKDHQKFAIEQAEILTRSLHNDLIKTIIDPTTDNFADISFRISGFDKVNALKIINNKSEAIYAYKDSEYINNSVLKSQKPLFKKSSLILKKPIVAEGYTFGYSIVDIDLSDYLNTQKQHLYNLLLILPITLLLSILLSIRLSKTYTHPFATLVKSMQDNDIENDIFYPVKTKSKNEIGKLFDGYNSMINTVKQASLELKYQSEHDNLTNTYNRFFIEKKANKLLKGTMGFHALALLDLDKFNVINNSVGFQAGDELLKMVALEISQLLPENAAVARIGGDDFYILVEDTNKEKSQQFFQKLLDQLHDYRFSWGGQAFSITASIGITFFKPNQYSFKELIKSVNSAFYTAKANGRGKLAIYTEDVGSSERYDHEIQVANEIKEALKDGKAKFELFAQAIVPLQYQSDKIGYEILIRMRDSKGNFVEPDNFLPTAERFQLMADIDIFVLWRFLETVTAHPEHLESLNVAHVNLAGSTLNNPDFQSTVKQAVKHFDFPWHKLGLELTETSAVGDLNHAKTFIQYLKKNKIGLTLDDFGTGMSSFEYLKKLPFDKVKIDGSFIKDMHTDPSDNAVIRYIHEISSLRNQETVAEYVETALDVKALAKIGITYAQGYYLGKPVPLSDWLLKDTPHS